MNDLRVIIATSGTRRLPVSSRPVCVNKNNIYVSGKKIDGVYHFEMNDYFDHRLIVIANS